jgi:hypothetical protein
MYKNNLFLKTKYLYFNSTLHIKNPNIQIHKQKSKHDLHKKIHPSQIFFTISCILQLNFFF